MKTQTETRIATLTQNIEDLTEAGRLAIDGGISKDSESIRLIEAQLEDWRAELASLRAFEVIYDWCDCGEKNGAFYWDTPTGHGWACNDCKRITQIG